MVADDKKIAKDIFISRENTKGAVTGHKVVVEITDYGEDRRNPEGKVIEILGHINDPGVDILSVIRRYELAVGISGGGYAEIGAPWDRGCRRRTKAERICATC